MACLDVDSVNEKIACIENLDEEALSNAFLNRYSVVAESATARAKKCPKVTITIKLEW